MERSSRDGWIAYHKGDYRAAAEAFAPTSVPRARALLELAALESDLARTATATWSHTFETWERKSGIPSGSAIPVVAARQATWWRSAPSFWRA